MLSDEEHRNRILTLRVKQDGAALNVKSINLNKKSNSDKHFTSDYEVEDLVVRRGKAFDITILFDREIDKETDIISLQFVVGSRPQESKGTLLRLKVDLNNLVRRYTQSGLWSTHVSDVREQELDVTVLPSANTIIGKYKLYVESSVRGKDGEYRRYELEDNDIYIIFNPWCLEDVVYMEDPKQREEYVLNEKGRIWVGTINNNTGRPWNFAQFDDPCLEAAFFLLDKAELADAARRSPVSVVRAVSALVNSNDDDGVLEGRWTQDYPKNTTPPWAWTGSKAILEEFMRNNKPVQYGQCWVFSAIVTSILRALGVPTRSVTNFQSAHDTDSSMTIDDHFDEYGEPILWMNDSIWNFHVWNESWFRRLDLPDGYDGWQAHDATPQELSEGVMRCGPAALKAIKEGHVYLSYDVPFIFSEVNGDRIHWKVYENGEMDVISIDKHAVGKKISTKAVGTYDRLDITDLYKYPEGSAEERQVVEFVNRYSTRVGEDIYHEEKTTDVSFSISVPEDTQVGSDVTVSLIIKNTSTEVRSVHGRMTILSSFYTGIPAKRLESRSYHNELLAGEKKTLELNLSRKEYQSKLNPEASFQLCVLFTVDPTGQTFVSSQAFTLSKPSLQITVPDYIKAGTSYRGTISFTNPLTINLINGVFHLESSSLLSAYKHEFRKPIKQQETVMFHFEFKALREGLREIVATFSSDQLGGVDGSIEFEVFQDIEPMNTDK
ncbi:protein-glutamine gamma-glutamyltransferase K-like [Pomacea canaliculata]|nr:protein-glutamine gamma-glutamyltransferase K-like [Pomacea canaliculata]XP_025075961.1 protein-glutamine gamma-glutamyltransferase K-like [Pomacea canaliculata]XP_025075962.1 protein-glutamine gamma-glutamyltransferase K-like [Pomacea canaliculata]